jgi:hypothetical protein
MVALVGTPKSAQPDNPRDKGQEKQAKGDYPVMPVLLEVEHVSVSKVGTYGPIGRVCNRIAVSSPEVGNRSPVVG